MANTTFDIRPSPDGRQYSAYPLGAGGIVGTAAMVAPIPQFSAFVNSSPYPTWGQGWTGNYNDIDNRGPLAGDYFVDPSHPSASDAGTGRYPNNPFVTIQALLNTLAALTPTTHVYGWVAPKPGRTTGSILCTTTTGAGPVANTIVRSSGSFIDEGFVAYMNITIPTGANAGTWFVKAVTATTLTLTTDRGPLVAQTANITINQAGYYRESTAAASGAAVGGNYLLSGGTSNNARVIVSGMPGTKPVLTGGLLNAPSKTSNGCILLRGASYVTIRNFEMCGTNSSPILCDPNAPVSYCLFENMWMHHTWVSENAGGIRGDWMDQSIIRNCVSNNHYRTFAGYNANPFDQESYGINAGFHGFEPGNCIVHNCLIFNVDKGVQHKQADRHGLDGWTVYGNIFYNCSDCAFTNGLQGSGLQVGYNPKFYDNICYNMPSATRFDLGDTTFDAYGLRIYNNTLINVQDAIGGADNMTDIEVYNNICTGDAPQWQSSVGQPGIWTSGAEGSHLVRISYWDYNGYNNKTFMVELGRNTANEAAYSSLALFRANAASHPEMEYDTPDASALSSDPLYVGGNSYPITKLKNGDASDYALLAGSPYINSGRGGVTRGAVRPGVTVGLFAPVPGVGTT